LLIPLYKEVKGNAVKSQHSTSTRHWRRVATVLATGVTMSLVLAGCSGGGGGASAESGSADDIEAALQEESTLTVWSWAPQVPLVAEAFMEEYPNVTVDVVNAGTSNDEYIKLQNAIKAGSGVPDVAQIEYSIVPQFALAESLADLTGFGLDSLEDEFTASTWEGVTTEEGLYGLPQDSGPVAMFYNKTVFDQYGIAVPATWDEYAAAAAQLHAADPTKFIASDSGDAGFTNTMIWQAGGTPYETTDGTNVTVDLNDEGAQKWAEVWNPLIEQDLLSPIVGWTDEWYKGLADGSIATMVTGAWMPANFETGVADAAGDWRVAPMPTYEAGESVSSESGGSSMSVLEQSENKLVAAGFLEWISTGEGAQVQIDAGSFPSTVADLTSDEFLNYKSDYFGGQEINKVLVQAAEDVVSGWSYLPFQAYANSIYADTAGQSYVSKTDILDGLAGWEEQIVDYGNEQGFTVTAE
jgi:multiple sugar transport system substrate-binding protein